MKAIQVWCLRSSLHIFNVIPANPGEGRGRAGIQDFEGPLDSRLRGNDDRGAPMFLYKFWHGTLAGD
ncbi:MAG: hypothetical protein HYU31_04320 [Deltaproteobacteria bacterium]|nr:hypothetical protein [Deltaproteobacteria bacterium]MBI2180028.1 hypothetical protein [Deltaproteobacteria bacterium]MBI2227799.1 hypothetical protein [Deltaproteobacteria bacterium]MBI2367772.1 hypothetical protein [Deltaproteobacteria bacterium]MBI3064693.1 hypothetical protein [Deltaproteobacteria bacterium]